MFHSKLTKVGAVASLIAVAIIFGCQTQLTSAVKATDFNAGNIISDAVFYNKDAMTLSEIETFIKNNTVACDTWGTKAVGSGRSINGVAVNPSTTRAKYADMMKAAGNTRYHAPPYICLTNYYENPTTKKTSFDSGAVKESGMLSAAEIIYKAAQTYNINPQALLVTLKKEYSYVYTDDWPLRDQYNTVMGYACPDSGPGGTANCNSKYYGFYNQVMNAAWQFNYYKENIKSYNYQPYRTNTIQYSTSSGCGSKQVYIENIATASLYIYTPYTPNAAALAAYPGTANCGSYGNRNFYMFFNEWFGSTALTPVVANPAVGDYYIIPKSNYDQSVQISKNSSDNGLPIVSGARAENAVDKFRLTKNTDGSYTIINISNTKALDVPNAVATEGLKVQQYSANGSYAQRWRFYDNGDGSYSIASTLSENLTLSVGSDNSIQLNSYSRSANQLFRIVPVSQYIADGTYSIHSKLKSNFTLTAANNGTTNGTLIQASTLTNAGSQRYQFTYNSKTGYYTIINPVSGKSIDVVDGNTANFTGIHLYSANGSCAQQWMIEKWGEDDYEFISSCSGKSLDVNNASTTNGAKIQIYSRNRSTAQKWSLTPVDTTQLIPDGTYSIESALKSNYVLDVANGSIANQTNVWMYSKNNSSAQHFKVEYNANNGTYTLTNTKSGKTIDVAGAGKTNSTNVQIYSGNGSCAQQWNITATADGHYEIASSCSGLVLDVSGAGLANGTNVHIYTRNSSSAQKWKLTPTN